VLDLEIIDQPDAAAVMLDPIKARILAALATPGSAASLASQVGLTRQKVNYHLRALEQHRLVEPVDARQWGGITERRMVASAASYIVSPAALGPIAANPAASQDRFSASYLLALASRIVREVGQLWKGARARDKRLATLSIDATIRFASPDARAAFTRDLTAAVTTLVARYHDADVPGGRPHRLIVASYPAPPDDSAQ
jgi:DNA-binding transcriptional ArsR family regulator